MDSRATLVHISLDKSLSSTEDREALEEQNIKPHVKNCYQSIDVKRVKISMARQKKTTKLKKKNRFREFCGMFVIPNKFY